jgi:hypothetical protein
MGIDVNPPRPEEYVSCDGMMPLLRGGDDYK